jgi:hypothetical protein
MSTRLFSVAPLRLCCACCVVVPAGQPGPGQGDRQDGLSGPRQGRRGARCSLQHAVMG